LGNFKHPFKIQAPHIESIHYPESGTISIKLEKQWAPAKYSKTEQRSFTNSVAQKKSTWDQISWLIFPEHTQTFYDVPHYNSWDLLYIGKVYMGTPKQVMNAIWDTGSSRFFVESDLCSNCINDVFITADSSTYTATNTKGSISYAGGTALKGYVGYDEVCPTTDDASCGSNF